MVWLFRFLVCLCFILIGTVFFLWEKTIVLKKIIAVQTYATPKNNSLLDYQALDVAVSTTATTPNLRPTDLAPSGSPKVLVGCTPLQIAATNPNGITAEKFLSELRRGQIAAEQENLSASSKGERATQQVAFLAAIKAAHEASVNGKAGIEPLSTESPFSQTPR